MAVPASPALTFVRSDNEVVNIYICSDADGVVPVDITGRTYVMSVAATAGGTVVTSATGTVTGASGLVVFTFATAKTVLLTGSAYVYDVVETASGVESTIMLGALSVLTAVTG